MEFVGYCPFQCEKLKLVSKVIPLCSSESPTGINYDSLLTILLCSKTAPRPRAEASVWTIIGKEKSAMPSTGDSVSKRLTESKVDCWT